jgi:hypothetical protein
MAHEPWLDRMLGWWAGLEDALERERGRYSVPWIPLAGDDLHPMNKPVTQRHTSFQNQELSKI